MYTRCFHHELWSIVPIIESISISDMILNHNRLYNISIIATLTILVATNASGVRQMNGTLQSGADWSATAESRVRAYCSNVFTVVVQQKH